MRDEKFIGRQVEKLYFILSHYNGADIDYQYEVLSHVLGDFKVGLSIQLKSDYPEVSTTPDKLFRYLQEGVSKLVTLSYNNLSKSENEKDKKEQEIRRLREENEDLHSRNKELKKLLKQYENSEKVREEANNKSNITEQDEVVDLSKYHAMANQELQDKIKEQKHTIEVLKKKIKENEGISKENLELKIRLKNAEEDLHNFESIEKALLPELQKGCFCKKYRGKSISLEPSQIEKVISGYLYGDSNYKISKDLGISHTTVKKILECDYSTSSSLNKILSALHSVNGNWGIERKQLLEDLIEKYEFEAKKATIDDRNNKLKIKGSITSLEDYINFKKRK